MGSYRPVVEAIIGCVQDKMPPGQEMENIDETSGDGLRQERDTMLLAIDDLSRIWRVSGTLERAMI